MTLAEHFAQMREHASADPMARAHQSLASHRTLVLWREARWSLILTVNR